MLLCLASWAIPGAGHLWLGRRTKGLIFLVALPLMFAIGLALHGRLFPFDLSEPLVCLAALADLGIGVAVLSSRARSATAPARCARSPTSTATRSSIVAGLLNLLVVIDAYDIAHGPEVMQSHLLLLVLFAFFVSLVFAVIAKDDVARAAAVRRHDVRRLPRRRRSCSAG